MIRSWLQLTRAQTAPATILLITIPFLVGGGELFSIQGLLLMLFAWSTHLISFGHNSLLDTQGGWDVKDPHKQHHPLVTSRISMKNAHNIIHTLMVVLAVVGVLLALYYGGNPLNAVIFLFLWFAVGHAYNDGLSKTLLPSFIPIALSIVSAGLYGYFLAAQEFSALSLWVAAYVFATIWFQTSIEGNLKEIESDEENLLVRLGARIANGRYLPGKAKYYGLFLMSLKLGIATYILTFSSIVVFPAFITLAVIVVVSSVLLLIPGAWDRNMTLKFCSLTEISSIYILPAILVPVIGWISAVFLMIFGIVYFVVLNYVNWGTILRPQV